MTDKDEREAEADAQWCYVIGYNLREYLEWCYENGYDHKRPDWVYAPDARWLHKHTQHAEPGYRYILTPRARERRDWPQIFARLIVDGAVRVNPDGTPYTLGQDFDAASGPRVIEPPQCLIWSHQHQAWWRPDRQGYTEVLHEAGRYRVRQTADICYEASRAWRHHIPEASERGVSLAPPVVRIIAPEYTAVGRRRTDETTADRELMQAVAERRVRDATLQMIEDRDENGRSDV